MDGFKILTHNSFGDIFSNFKWYRKFQKGLWAQITVAEESSSLTFWVKWHDSEEEMRKSIDSVGNATIVNVENY